MSIKVLHIIDHLGFGGAQTIMKGIFESQQKNKNIFLCVLRKKHNRVLEIQHENVTNYNTKAKFSFTPIKKIRGLILKNNINILHCHLFKAQIFGFILKRVFFPAIYLIFHEHGAIIGSDNDNIVENYLYRKFITISARNVNIYIAVSNAIKDKLIEKAALSKDKIVTLYNFVDLNKFNPQKLVDVRMEQKRLGIQQDDFVVGFAGRIVERKGWREYIEAAEILLKTLPNIKFLIAGDGHEKYHLLHIIERDCFQDKIIFLGYIADTIQFYSYLHCFVMPSLWEPMGMTELEAQACGIPVIATNIPGLNEIVQHNYNGLLFELKNTQDLAEKIKRLYHNKYVRQKLTANGLRSVFQYSLDNFLLKLNIIYDKCANGSSV